MTVSVVIPAYNATAFLERTVPAVLDLQGALEWIWVDDGSTDATGVELRRLTQGHPSVRILELGRNEGRAAARNAGIELAKGDWIACLDVDARPRPGYLLAHQEVFARPEAVVSMGSIHPADPVPGDPYSQYLSAYPRGVPSRQLVASWKHFVTCAACIRADALRSVGGFDESIGYGEDAELACRLAPFSPAGLHVASGAVVDLFGTETLDGARAKARQFGCSLRQIEARNPHALDLLGLGALRKPVQNAILRSDGFARFAEASLRWLPDALVSTGVRYLLGHALARGYADG